MKKIYIILSVFLITFSLQANAITTNLVDSEKRDEQFMQIAIGIAKHNPKQPFGALIVDNKTNKILAEGLNASQLNPTFHGEIVAINNCVKKHPHVDWSNVTLYTTAEPCPMCQGAIIWAGIPRVVFGTSIEYLGTHGWHQISIKAADVAAKAGFYKGSVTGGVLANQTNILFNKNA